MQLHVVHETRYDYTPPVENAQHIAHLRPRDTDHQRLLEHRLRILPGVSSRGELTDVWGNTRTSFALQSAHTHLSVIADSRVRTTAPPSTPLQPGGSLPWEQVAERFRYRAGGRWDPAAEFVFPSEYVPRHDEFTLYAQSCFAPGTPVLAAAHALMRRIHAEFTYKSESTDIDTPAVDALARRRGVCQDFAHIMVACVRAMGVPARYVSGYLLTQPPPGGKRLIGCDASHAWVAVYSPCADAGRAGTWYDFDPTNDRTPGEDYVTLAWGRDFGDVSPMRGLLHGGGDHALDVGVTVEPIPESDAMNTIA